MMPGPGDKLPKRKKPAEVVKAAVDAVHTENAPDTEKSDHEIVEGLKRRPVVFKTWEPGTASGGGLVIGILALPKGKKSVLAGLYSYANQKFKNDLPPDVYEMLHQGKLPEIEEVNIVDTEETWNKDLDHGFMGMMLRPVADAGIKINVESTPLLVKREKVVDGEIVNLTSEYDVEKMRDNFEAAVWSLGDKAKAGNSLNIIDSMSDYKVMLTDELNTMEGKTVIKDFKKKEGGDEETTAVDRKDYGYRNKWWTNILMKLRASGSWVVETYKIGERDEEYRYKDVKIRIGKSKDGKALYREETVLLDQYYPIWVKLSDYRIDQGYTILNTIDDKGNDDINIRVDWAKHRHKVMQYSKLKKDQREANEAKCLLPYAQNDRMAAMYLLEDMAPAILQTEVPDDQLWGKYHHAGKADVDGKGD